MYNICSEKCGDIKKTHSLISQVKQFNCPVVSKLVFFLMKCFKAPPSSLFLAVPSDKVHLVRYSWSP